MPRPPKNYLQWFLRYLYALPYDEARGTLKAASAGLDAHHSMTDPQQPLADDAGEPLIEESEAMQ